MIAKRIQMRHNLLTITAWQLVIGSLPLLVVSALVERDAPIIWTVQFAGLLLFLALVGTSLAVAAWYWLVQQEDVGRLTLFFFLVPLFGLVIAAVLFGEPISLLAGVGAALTVVGTFTTAREVWRTAPSVSSKGVT